jgi:hypothetical protein
LTINPVAADKVSAVVVTTARDSGENRVTDTCSKGSAGGRFDQEVVELVFSLYYQ